jgi:hypothetical protein
MLVCKAQLGPDSPAGQDEYADAIIHLGDLFEKYATTPRDKYETIIRLQRELDGKRNEADSLQAQITKLRSEL